MMLQDLFDTTMHTAPKSRQNNTKTAIRVLAHALGYDTPTKCPETAYNKPLKTLFALVEQDQQGKGPHTLRNSKNNLSYLFKAAERAALIALPTPIVQQKYTDADYHNRPNRKGSQSSRQDGAWWLFKHWSPALQHEWETFYQWATAPLVENRPAKWRKRHTSLESYLMTLEGFFGYLVHEQQMTPDTLSFDHVFDLPRITAYVHWHVNVRHHRTTCTILIALTRIKTLATQYRPLPNLVDALKDLTRSLPKPPPTYDKNEVWLPLATIAEVGRALWPTRMPQINRSTVPTHPGRRFASRAGYALMIQLWCFIPYRSRNMREMTLHTHLQRDAQGEWIIRFSGADMKIATKRGKDNQFDMPFPPELVPTLETYLRVWRPILSQQTHNKHNNVFLNILGKPHERKALTLCLSKLFFRYTGKSVHPHIIRTIWATEYIQDTGDLMGAAVMLNDRLETVVANYSHLREQGIADKAFAWVRTAAPAPTTDRAVAPSQTTLAPPS